MIFNKNQNYTAAINEFRVHVALLDKKTPFDQLIPDIENAEYELGKIIGPAVMEKAVTEYMENTGETENELVRHVQAAVATIAFRDYTTNSDLLHSPTGRKASINSSNEKQAWEFFIERDNEALNYRIQKALNRLIDYLEREKITEWTGSAAYRIRHRVLLSSIELFERFYPIDNSLALFNQLLPFQAEMQRKYILPVVGSEMMGAMSALNPEGSGSGEGSARAELLFDYAGLALALWTMATGIKRLSVKLLPEGLVQQFRSSVQSRTSSFPVKGSEKDLIVSSLIKDAEIGMKQLEDQVRIFEAEDAGTEVAEVTMLGERNLDTNKYFSM